MNPGFVRSMAGSFLKLSHDCFYKGAQIQAAYERVPFPPPIVYFTVETTIVSAFQVHTPSLQPDIEDFELEDKLVHELVVQPNPSSTSPLFYLDPSKLYPEDHSHSSAVPSLSQFGDSSTHLPDFSFISFNYLVGSYLTSHYSMPIYPELDPKEFHTLRAFFASITVRPPPVQKKDIGTTSIPSCLLPGTEWWWGKQPVLSNKSLSVLISTILIYFWDENARKKYLLRLKCHLILHGNRNADRSWLGT